MQLHSPLRGAFNLARRLMPRRRPETQQLRGLEGDVEVITDDWGVSHIYADTAHDLFFGQGFVTARDRLFQMDYNRHGAAGRLCELVGRRELPWRDLTVHLKAKTTFDVDVMLRTFGMARSARESLPMHSQESRDMLTAYAAGVNAYIATGARTLEHRILRTEPKPWTELDSLLMLKGIGFELNFGWRGVLFGALLDQADVPEDLTRVLWPHYRPGGPTIVDPEIWASAASDLARTREAAGAALGIGNAPGVGSNSFVVAGSHSKNGDALAANDTHLVLTAPQPWHEVRLHGGGFDMRGFALTGVPGIAVGKTPHHTWGITAGMIQDLDLFAERLHPDDDKRYLTPDGWQTLTERHEEIIVRGEATQKRTIYSSRHGPLLETVATEADAGYRLAVAWTGHTPGRDLDGLLGIWKAESFDAFRDSLRHLVCPTYNITYADRDGQIGYVLAGIIPRRRIGAPLRPLEGWTGEWDWQGTVPYEENPYVLNPENGFLVTANNRVASWDYPYELGGLFEPPQRYERITHRLVSLGKSITRQDLALIQLDNETDWGRRCRDRMIDLVGGVYGLAGSESSIERQAAEIWSNWDGFADRDSAGAAIGLPTALGVAREVVRRIAGEEAAFGFAEFGSFVGQPTIELLELAPRLRELGVDLGQVIRQTFQQTVDRCRQEMGDSPARWTWGALHPIVCKHRMDGTPLGRFFNIGPEPAGGGPDSVNRGDTGAKDMSLRVGPALRFVASARELDEAGTVIPGGQSGDRLSKHYDDQLVEFLAGRLKPAPMSKGAVTVAFRETLKPKG